MTNNCNGTAIAGITDSGELVVYYTEDFVLPEALLTPDKLGDNLFSTKKNKEEK